ncbi:hypothetical protein ANCCAN_12725 [Ancylostoma caninum]|uniref:Schwannomin interacting protein 1 C-terminal domain-containing protein n=1 Tax=Ancylostoma caninum TaxID=29170 RepID=A0A368GAE3_ANCCA|nr:hypothetical protein ANCCAN_12725 [Ancylostoma caninum]
MEGPSSPNLTTVYGCAASPEARDDSGVSTMESVCGKDFEHDPAPSTVRTLADILLSEHNNNYAGSMDVVKLLRLRSVDDEQNQQSNSSSLESLSSLENHQGSQGPDVDGGSGSTSCSEDSFEMSSSEPNNSSGSAITLYDEDSTNRYSNLLLFRQPPSSISMDSFMLKNTANMSAIRESINLELQNLDTEPQRTALSVPGLPELDFVKLEEQLTNAAREREEHDRRLLGEEVRRRLALQADSWKGASPAVCYMNELAESASESEISESDDEFMVPKSRSTPNLKGTSRPGSSREDPYLRKLRDRAVHEQHLDPSPGNFPAVFVAQPKKPVLSRHVQDQKGP